jgi:hypothetical protein
MNTVSSDEYPLAPEPALLLIWPVIKVLPQLDCRTIAKAVGCHAIGAKVDARVTVDRLRRQLYGPGAVVAKARACRRNGGKALIRTGPRGLPLHEHLAVQVDQIGYGVCQWARGPSPADY